MHTVQNEGGQTAQNEGRWAGGLSTMARRSGSGGEEAMKFWEKVCKGKKAARAADYDVESENLAVPEVHCRGQAQPEERETAQEEITYDDVAIPEIHVKKKR